MDRQSKRIWLRLALQAGMAALVFTAVWLKMPCLLRMVSGIPCPSCGMTRAGLACFRLVRRFPGTDAPDRLFPGRFVLRCHFRF